MLYPWYNYAGHSCTQTCVYLRTEARVCNGSLLTSENILHISHSIIHLAQPAQWMQIVFRVFWCVHDESLQIYVVDCVHTLIDFVLW